MKSEMAVTNADGQVIETASHESFGKVIIKDIGGNFHSQSIAGNPWLFAGMEYDPEIGLHHAGMREYSPATGRFIQEDPLDLAGGDINLFTYANNSPTLSIDPFGLSPQAGIQLAKKALCEAGGKADVALANIRDQRDIRSGESTTPEGSSLRDADHFLFAYYVVINGSVFSSKYISYAAMQIGTPVRSGYKLIRPSKYPGSPASWDEVLAGWAGANSAISGGCKCGK